MTARQRQQPDARTALAQRRENGDAGQPKTDIRGRIEKLTPEFQRAMPRGREAAQLVRDALTCLRTTRDLDKCGSESILGALMTCAQLGLRPGVLGQAYVLPFWDRNANDGRGGHNATLVVGYQGLVDLALRSGRLDDLIARTVYADDVFDVDYGLDARLIHKPAMFRDGYYENPDQDPAARAYYAVVRYRGGGSAFWAMSRVQVERHAKRYSKQKTREGALKGPWRDEFDGMAMKTCIRQLAKFMPKSPEFAALLQGIQVDEGVRLNYSPDATPEETTRPVEDYIDGEVAEPPASEPVGDEPPPMEEWPEVAPAGGDR